MTPTGRYIFFTLNDEEYEYRQKNQRWGFYDAQGTLFEGESPVLDGLEGIRTANAIGEMINDLVKSDRKIVINQVEGENKIKEFDDGGEIEVSWNPYEPHGGVGKLSDGTYTRYRHENCALAHELGHAYDYSYLSGEDKKNISILHPGVDSSEMVACIIENSLREVYGDPIRISYGINKGSGKETISQKSLLNYTRWDRRALYNIMLTK